MNCVASPSLSLAYVIRAMRVSVAAWGGRGWLSTALVWLLYRRLGDIGGRMERLAARFQAGRLWTVGTRAGVRRASDGTRPVGAERAQGERIWPVRFGWLVRAAAWHAAAYTGQLRIVLQQPEMVALLIAAPQAARILRPLCRMLAVETSLLRPGPVAPDVLAPDVLEPDVLEPDVLEPDVLEPGVLEPGVVATDVVSEAAPVVAKRVRAKRVPVDWGRIPLPRGVLAAARRDRCLKG